MSRLTKAEQMVQAAVEQELSDVDVQALVSATVKRFIVRKLTASKKPRVPGIRKAKVTAPTTAATAEEA